MEFFFFFLAMTKTLQPGQNGVKKVKNALLFYAITHCALLKTNISAIRPRLLRQKNI